MIKFFRKIRQKLLRENQFSKYLLYAIGEIILVVIGILIALQINNWNDARKDNRLEEFYLINIQEDLNSDLVNLEDLVQKFNKAVASKEELLNFADGNRQYGDSLPIYFRNQFNFVNDFAPNTTTIDEIKNSGNFNIITDNSIRRNLVKLYNTYDNLSIKLARGSEKQQKVLDHISRHLNDIGNPTKDETIELMTNKVIPNFIRANYLYSQKVMVREAHDLCLKSINEISSVLND